MSTPYISTATVGDAHNSDILGVCITERFTVTVSSDGFLKLWDNLRSERSEYKKVLVNQLGLHHVACFEDVVDMKKVLIIAVVSFSGKLYLYKYDFDANELIDLEFDAAKAGMTNKTAFWFPQFDSKAASIVLACTTVSGKTKIFDVMFEENGELVLTWKGELYANDNSFATSLCLDLETNKAVVGHQNGNVYLYDTEQMLLSYNFESSGLKNSKSLNIVRDIKFSPNGELLAIASDSGPFGTITLYDVKYGEYMGSFIISTHSSNVGVGNFAHSKWCLSIDFNKTGDKLVSCGLDNNIRVWNVETRTCVNTLRLNSTDLDDDAVSKLNDMDTSACTNIKFVPQGIFKEDGQNDGLVVVGFDRSIRWYREAGGL